jgi:antitoxin MazE
MRIPVSERGDDITVSVPKSVAERSNIVGGSFVDVRIEEGSLVLSKAPRYSLDELLAAVTEENVHAETDTGLPVGREEM